MKVGLCACYANRNYGSMLQSYASQIAIERLGHSCEMIRYKKHYSGLQLLRQVPRIFNGGNIRRVKRWRAQKRAAAAYPAVERQRSERRKCFDSYRDATFTSLSPEFIGFDALVEGSKRYGAVVVGSDQLWLPMGLPTNFYNLQFAAPSVRRVSYATSFGVSQIPWYQKGRTADFLQKIDFLSVREESGAQICNEVAGVEAKVVVDPTLLLTRDEWAEAVFECRSFEEPYIFCYFLGRNPLCREEARRVSEETGLPIVTLRHLDEIVPSDESFGDYALYDVDPAGFVNLIRGAEYVLTDSFHGTVFSVIHNKRFATFYRFATADRQSRNSRIDSLFSHLHFHDHLVTEPGAAMPTLAADIDSSSVDERLASWRADSWDFLREALS